MLFLVYVLLEIRLSNGSCFLQLNVYCSSMAALVFSLTSDIDCSLVVFLFLQAVAKYVYISKEDVLQQAFKDLSLEIQEINTYTIGNDQIIGSMCINAPPFGKYSMLHQKKFFGDYKLTEEATLESAKLATLLHL